MSLQTFSVNGLKVYLDIVPGMKNIDAQLVVGVGSVDEPDDLAGICHALEHCTHLQTASFNGQPEIDAFADEHSFYRNADTYYTRTRYYTKGLEPEPMFQLLGELTTTARFKPARVAEEMKSIRREARTGLDDIDTLDFPFRDYVLFGLPYGREILGYHDRLDFSADTLAAFYEKYYILSNMTLIVVGDITADTVRHLANTYIVAHARTGSFERSELPVPKRPYPNISTFGRIRDDSTNARLCLETEAPLSYIQQDDNSEWSYSAARSLISKAVIDDIRYKRGLSYDGFFGLGAWNHRTACRFRAEVTVDTADITQTFDALRAVLNRSPDSFSDDEIVQALAKQRRSAAEDVDNVLGRADVYVNTLSLGSPIVSAEDSYQTLLNTTPEDVRHALAETLEIWQKGDIIECVTGSKEAVGDRFVVDQSLFA